MDVPIGVLWAAHRYIHARLAWGIGGLVESVGHVASRGTGLPRPARPASGTRRSRRHDAGRPSDRRAGGKDATVRAPAWPAGWGGAPGRPVRSRIWRDGA